MVYAYFIYNYILGLLNLVKIDLKSGYLYIFNIILKKVGMISKLRVL